jgi:hypothetical protein
MWMINPKLLCDKHLIAEHGEIHKHLPSFRKRNRIDGRFYPVVQIQLWNLPERHDDLAEEMLHRGMNHKSPLLDVPDLKKLYPTFYYKNVDPEVSIIDLQNRCNKCARRIRRYYENAVGQT